MKIAGRAPSHRRRRGVTFIEVALSVALLAGLAGMIATSYDSMQRLGVLQQHKIYATEVAHRLILNYLLDPSSLPEPGERIPYSSEFFYRHELLEEMLVEDRNTRAGETRRRAVAQRALDTDAIFGAGLKMVTVRVYPLAAAEGGSGVGDPFTPLAEVRRIYSPVDSESDSDIILRQVESLLGRSIALPEGADPREIGRTGGGDRR